jgi:hypothetical protein
VDAAGVDVYDALPLIAVGLVLATIPFVLLLLIRRVMIDRRYHRQRLLEQRVRPIATALVFGEGEIPEAKLPAAEADALAIVLGRYARLLSGGSRGTIAAYFERYGGVARGIRQLRSLRAWRRAHAARLLGDMGSPLAVDPLIAALRDRSGDVRRTAAESLGGIGAVEGVEPILEAVADDRLARPVAGRALLSVGDAALVPVMIAARNPDPEARRLATELLARLGGRAQAPLLIAALGDPSHNVRAIASRGLGRLVAGGEVEIVRRMLNDPVPSVRAAAATGLGAIGDRASVAELERVAREDTEFAPGRAAARALTLIDPRHVLESDDEDAGPHIREAADRIRIGVA